jgi:hypothetical protein
MPVTQTATATFEQDLFLTVISYITQILSCLCIVCHCAAWNLYDNILTILAETLVAATVPAILSERVSFITQVKQCPIVPVSPEYHTASFAAVAAVWTTVGYILVMPQMSGASPAFS